MKHNLAEVGLCVRTVTMRAGPASARVCCMPLRAVRDLGSAAQAILGSASGRVVSTGWMQYTGSCVTWVDAVRREVSALHILQTHSSLRQHLHPRVTLRRCSILTTNVIDLRVYMQKDDCGVES
jgi:hypothetical protein